MILITGATGNNGQEIVRLLSRMEVPCRALVRSNEKAGSLSDLPGVALAYGDFARPDSLTASLEGVDRALLISSIDPKLPELQGNFIQAAKRAGVRYIVKFSGAWAMGGADLREWRFARWHAEAEKILEDSGLAFTHLQPNQFMQIYLRFQTHDARRRENSSPPAKTPESAPSISGISPRLWPRSLPVRVTKANHT